MSKYRSNRGFTLIELLVVIAIIGILAATIIVSLTSARKKAQDSTVKSDVNSMMQAIEVYKVDNNNAAPIEGSGLTVQGQSTSGTGAVLTELNENFPTLPKHPGNGTVGTFDINQKDVYGYDTDANGTSYIFNGWLVSDTSNHFTAKDGSASSDITVAVIN